VSKLAYNLFRRKRCSVVDDPSRREAIVQQVTQRLFTSSNDYDRLKRSNGQFADAARLAGAA
jgi:hypothetical protein